MYVFFENRRAKKGALSRNNYLKPLKSTQIHIHSLYIYIFTIFVACTSGGWGGGSVSRLLMPILTICKN